MTRAPPCACAGSVDPQSITYMLHELFCTLDRMCLKMRIYKLDTVGDCYIALDGLDGQPGHATRVVDYAIRAVAEAVTMMQARDAAAVGESVVVLRMSRRTALWAPSWCGLRPPLLRGDI